MIDILVVDDDEVAATVAVEQLEEVGYRAAAQHGPFGTLNRVKQEQPRLVVLDVNMPGIPGPELASLLKEMKQAWPVRILLHSSETQERLAEIASRSAVDGWVTKSAGREALIEKVREMLRSDS
ncbi:MAG: response regulator [Myxococcota bacterium]